MAPSLIFAHILSLTLKPNPSRIPLSLDLLNSVVVASRSPLKCRCRLPLSSQMPLPPPTATATAAHSPRRCRCRWCPCSHPHYLPFTPLSYLSR
ncbi:hypothetical protein Syun_000706 [Stephania yunnanensis]|uniref:Uncharacterized protein n=1 Tax=Stephania yunnanensis TaxID=152371 RepID=A0AAP0QA61_9MAGN